MMSFIGLYSCNNFLNVTPKNVISMDDLESIKNSLGGFLYNVAEDGSGRNSMPWSPFDGSRFYSFWLYSDIWDLNSYAADELDDYEIQKIDWRNEDTQGLWGDYYSVIGFMNLIINEALVAEGDEGMRDYILGEAYTMRAYCFFKLVQYYAPYNDNELGIPICLESEEDLENVSLVRRTQTEVYSQILADLGEAEKCLERTPTREGYNVMYKSTIINRLFAEIYHFKAMSAAAEATDWENAIKYADRETNGKMVTSDYSIISQVFNAGITALDNDPECGIRCSSSGAYGMNSFFSSNSEPNQDFYKEYFPEDEGDIRRNWYQEVEVYDYTIWDYVYKLKINKFSTYTDYLAGWYYLYCGFRLSEAFLIQAEAYVMTDQLAEARDILDRFKSCRYTNSYVVPEDKEALLQDIYRERKKEFLAELDYAWLDMKRLGVEMERTVGGQTFKLNGADDYRYAFPIPTYELENNKEMVQNPVWILND